MGGSRINLTALTGSDIVKLLTRTEDMAMDHLQEENKEALKTAGEYLEKLIDDKETMEYMQKRSVEIFNERFTAQIYAENIEAVYDELMKK